MTLQTCKTKDGALGQDSNGVDAGVPDPSWIRDHKGSSGDRGVERNKGTGGRWERGEKDRDRETMTSPCGVHATHGALWDRW